MFENASVNGFTHLYPENSLVVGARGSESKRERVRAGGVREILNLYRQTPIGNRSIPRGNFPFPSPFSMDGAQPSWKREGGREGEKK